MLVLLSMVFLLISSLLRLAYCFAHAAGQEVLAKGALGRLSGRLSSPAKQDVPLAEEVSSDQGEPAFASGGISNQSSGHLMGNSGERAARQVSQCRLISRQAFHCAAPYHVPGTK